MQAEAQGEGRAAASATAAAGRRVTVAAAVRLTVHVLSQEVRAGGWCNVCALPSLVEVVLTLALAGGVSQTTATYCTDHGPIAR